MFGRWRVDGILDAPTGRKAGGIPRLVGESEDETGRFYLPAAAGAGEGCSSSSLPDLLNQIVC